MFLNFGDGGDLLVAMLTVTISTSTTSVLILLLRNGLSASRSIIFTQGTGSTTFTLPSMVKSALNLLQMVVMKFIMHSKIFTY